MLICDIVYLTILFSLGEKSCGVTTISVTRHFVLFQQQLYMNVSETIQISEIKAIESAKNHLYV